MCVCARVNLTKLCYCEHSPLLLLPNYTCQVHHQHPPQTHHQHGTGSNGMSSIPAIEITKDGGVSETVALYVEDDEPEYVVDHDSRRRPMHPHHKTSGGGSVQQQVRLCNCVFLQRAPPSCLSLVLSITSLSLFSRMLCARDVCLIGETSIYSCSVFSKYMLST